MRREVRRGRRFVEYQEDDGRLTQEICAGDVNYLDDNGTWQPINLDWEDDSGGFAFRASRPNHKLRFDSIGAWRWYPRRNVETEYIVIGRPQCWLEATKRWGNLLANGISRDGNEITITSVRNVTRKLRVLWNGFKTDYILENANAPKRYRYPVELVGVTEQDGLLYGADGEIVGILTPTSAQDADGKDLACTSSYANGYVEFEVDPDGAAYPVNIDPDFVGDTADGYVMGFNNTSYSDARNTSIALNNTNTLLSIGQYYTYQYFVGRSYLKFDTSSLPDNAIVTSTKLKLTVNTNYSDTDFDIIIKKQNWSSQDPLSDSNREAAYDNCLTATDDDNIWRNTNGISTNTPYESGELNKSWINKTGNTYYSLLSSRDKSATTPTGNEYIYIYSAEYSTASYRRPTLVVTYKTPDELTGRDVIAGSSIEKPTLGQKHTLTGGNVSSIPSAEKPALAQTHLLTGGNVSAIPSAEKPTIGQMHTLTGSDIIAVPIAEKPDLGQEHPLIGNDVIASSSIEKPTIGQEHTFTGEDVISIPLADKPNLAQEHRLSGGDVSSVSLAEKPDLGQTHILNSGDVIAVPIAEKPILGQTHQLLGGDVIAVPIAEKPTIVSGQIYDLEGQDVISIPSAGTPDIGQEHQLSGSDVIAIPIAEKPILGQTHQLTSQDVVAIPIAEKPLLAILYIFDGRDVIAIPIIEKPTLGQSHSLTGGNVSSVPEADKPDLGQTHILTSQDVVSIPEADKPDLGQTHIITSGDVTAIPIAEEPVLGQEHELSGSDVIAIPIAEKPMLGQVHNLLGKDVVAQSFVEKPSIGQIHNLVALPVVAGSSIEMASLGQLHQLIALDVVTISYAGMPDIHLIFAIPLVRIYKVPFKDTAYLVPHDDTIYKVPLDK
jgi:hypothetical protein